MSSLLYLIPLALLLGGAALAAFMWSLRSGQYDDLDGAAERIFLEEGGDRAGDGERGLPAACRTFTPLKKPSDSNLTR